MAKQRLLDGNTITIEDVVAIARFGENAGISGDAKDRIVASRKCVERFIAEGKAIYGLNTGFGMFSDVAITSDQLDELQKNLIYADAVGIGRPFDTEIVRAIMVLRANALAKGFSGIRLGTVEILVEMINKRVHPVIREKGSVGSSGDLCPLAHLVLVMMGEGEAEYGGVVMPGAEAMKLAGITPVVLKAKEGLALINGTCAMMGVSVLTVYDSLNLLKTADIVASLTIEALEGIRDAFDPRVHQVRNQKWQESVARNLLRLTEGSKLLSAQGEKRMQDGYTLRCVPQIHGASRPAYEYVRQVIENEINAATDNPLIFPEGEGAVISGGNFHGQPVAIAMDTLGIAVAELGNVSERRIERLVNPTLSGLPAFLVSKGGLNCGFMVPQYAAAAVVSENKILAHPASVDSIPTSANQEDHVSMGTIAARKAREILGHVEYVLGIELLCGAQAVDFKDKTRLGSGSRAAYETIRSKVTFMESDRIIYPDMDQAAGLIHSGQIVRAVEAVVGVLE
jgi:histidine ammonia-lyase